MTNVLPLPMRTPQQTMSPEEFDRRKQEIEATNEKGYHDQSLAKLYQESNWTQRQLAEHLKMSQTWVKDQLRFARFVLNANGVQDLAERKFRGFWKKTDKNEEEDMRFAAVSVLIEKDSKDAAAKKLAQGIRKKFDDGKLHQTSEIAESFELEETETDRILRNMTSNAALKSHAVNKRGNAYSIKKIEPTRTGDLDALYEEVKPIIKALKTEGRKKETTLACLAQVAYLADKLDELLKTYRG